MAYFLLVVLFFIFAFYCYYFNLHYNERGKLINMLPGPMQIPFFGNMFDLHVNPVEINEKLRNWNKTYFPVFKLWLGIKPLIFISHPDDLEILLTSSKHINKQFVYESLGPWLGTGLLTSGGQKWFQRRKILTKAFHFTILKKYMNITNNQTEQLISNIRSEGKETTKYLLSFSSSHTLNIICETAMGVSLDSNKSGKSYKDAVYKIGDIIVYRVLRPYIQDWMLYLMPKFKKNVDEVLYNLNTFTNNIVEERRDFHKKTNYTFLTNVYDDETTKSEVEVPCIDQKKKLAMLDLLLDLENNGAMDDEGIKEEVGTFVFEGHDTTAMALCFSILLFSLNKDAQDKARREVEEILSPKDGKLETSDLLNMNYLEMCIKETLRLYPSVPSIARYLLEDLKLRNCTIPKNTNVIINLTDTHRDPNFWPEPDKFDPDRFLPECIKKRHTFCYLPFSAGPRNCIGQKFAMMELKSLLANILYNFYLEPIDTIDDFKLYQDIVIRPNKDLQTKFVRIDRKCKYTAT